MKATLKHLISLTILLLPLSQVSLPVFGYPLYLPEAVIVCSSCIYVFAVLNGRMAVRRIPSPACVGAGLFLVGAIVSAAAGGSDVQEVGAIKSWIAFPVLYGFLVFQTMDDNRDRKELILSWYAGVLMTALVSLLPLPFVRETYDGRLASYFPSPNHLAFFMEPGVIIASIFMVESFGRKAGRGGWFFILGSVPIIFILFRTESVGAMVACAVAVSVLAVLRFAPRRTWTRLASLILVAGIMMTAYLLPRVDISRMESGQVRTSLSSRVMIWKASFHLLREHPIFGIGLRDFEREYLAIQPEFPPYLEWAVPHPHNIVLSLWLMTGLSGLVGFCVLFVSLSRMIWSEFLCATDDTDRLQALLLLSILVLFLTHGLVDTPFFRNDLSLQFFAVTGMALTFVNKTPSLTGRRAGEGSTKFTSAARYGKAARYCDR